MAINIEDYDLELIKTKYKITYKCTIKMKKAEDQFVTMALATGIDDKKDYIIKKIQQYREVQIMENLKGHHNIIQIKDYIEEYNLIVMEKAQCDLKQYIQKAWPIPDQTLHKITLDILTGIHDMHKNANQYWHRDLKPENIFLFSQKQGEKFNYKNDKVIAKIGDLGSARQYVEGLRKFTSGVNVGTEAYRCPQLLNDESNYNNKIDIWSLAIVLFQLYSKSSYYTFYKTNRMNCRKEEGIKLINEYVMKQLDNVKQKSNFLPVIKDIIKQCIKYNPQQRPNIKQILQQFTKGKVGVKPVQINKKLVNQKRKWDMNEKTIQKWKNASKKVEHLLNSLKMNPNPIQKYSTEVNDDNNIIMKNVIQQNLKWQLYEDKAVIQKYQQYQTQVKKTINLMESHAKDVDIQQSRTAALEFETRIKTQLNEIRKTARKNLDICFLIDGTGSMQSLINKVIQNIVKLDKDLQKENSGYKKIRVACVVYRDFDCTADQQIEVFNFDTSETILNKIKSLKATGGGDEAEDINRGLQKVMTLDWKSYSKAIFHFADAPCHYGKYNGYTSQGDDNYVNKLPPSDISYKKIFRQLKSTGINYFIIQIRPIKSLDVMYEAFQKDYSDAGCYRSRTNVLGELKYIDHKKYQQGDFLSLLLDMGQQINLITTKHMTKKRIAGTQYKKQFAYDKIDEKDEFS